MTFARKDMETIMINGSLALKPQAVPVPVHTSKLSPLITNGWVKGSLGQYRSNGQIKTRNGFDLYVRRRNLGEYIDACSKKSSLGKAHNPFIYKTFEAGSSSSMGDPEPKLTPSSSAAENPLSSTYRRGNSLPALSSFSEYPSLMAARKGKPCLLIGYDSEWETHQSGRDMLSWQYALVDGVDLVEFVFLKTGEKKQAAGTTEFSGLDKGHRVSGMYYISHFYG